MYTECPHCQKQFKISVQQLKDSEGRYLCNRCYAEFDPVPYLKNDGFIAFCSNLFNRPKQITSYQSEEPSISNNVWLYSVIAGLVLFSLQLIYFESSSIAQNKSFRPWLEKVSNIYDWPLEPYKDLQAITVLDASLESTASGAYLFKMGLVNQAEFTQAYPSIKLSLIDFVGRTFAQRVFKPEEITHKSINEIKPEAVTQISMIISAPANKIGGYHFELI